MNCWLNSKKNYLCSRLDESDEKSYIPYYIINIGFERLLSHDSIRADLKRQQEVLEILAYTERMQNDTLGWIERSRELVGVCRQIGTEAETDALRSESEIGAALCAMGQYEQGMAKLDSAMVLLSE